MNNINSILEDIFRLDPDLKMRADEVTATVEEMVAARPNAEIDDEFLVELRTRLIKRAGELNGKTQTKHYNLSWFPKFAFVGASLVLCVAAAWTIVLSDRSGNTGAGLALKLDNFNDKIKIGTTKNSAFGSLALNDTVENSAARNSVGIGGGGASTMAAAPQALAETPPSRMPATSKMIAYDDNWRPTIYKYKYSGESFTLSDSEVGVLKRVRGVNASAKQLANVLKNTDLGLANLKSFGSLAASNISMFEDKEGGYFVNVSLEDGTLTIDRYLTRWSNATRCAGSARCIEPSAGLTIADVPTDETLFSIAGKFLSDRGIKLVIYDKPVIAYPIDRTKPAEFAPEIMTLTYPLKISGQPVYEEYGGLFGIQVNVSIRDNKVVSVTSLTTQNYTSSKYNAVTDSTEALAYAANGGWRSYAYPDPSAVVVEVELDTPVRGYIKMWKYNENGTDELLVPALIFPVKNKPVDMSAWGGKNQVIVPLVKEILASDENEPPIMLYKAL